MRGCLPWIIVLLILCSPLFLWMAWALGSVKPVSTLVFDKSVVDTEYAHHAGLFWLMQHNKYVRKELRFHPLDDFYGLQPMTSGKYMVKTLTGVDDVSLDSLARTTDILLALDSYGVRSDQWNRGKLNDDASPFLDGGYNSADISVMQAMDKAGKPIYLEASMFSPNMQVEDRWSLEDMAGIKWQGWRGGCFATLNPEKSFNLPKRWIELWESQNGHGWKFTEPGIVMIREDSLVIVLAQGKQANLPYLTVRSDLVETMNYKIPAHEPYTGMFEVITPVATDLHVISNFEFSVNSRGDSLLESVGLPRSFPALMVRKNLWIATGDFTSYVPSEWTSHFNGIEWLMRNTLKMGKKNPFDTEHFFYEYYCPMMSGMLANMYNTLPISKQKQGFRWHLKTPKS